MDIKILIGIAFLIIGFPIGVLLSKKTKEELTKNQIWFKILIILSLMGSIISLILRNDILFFSFLFIAIVTSGSLLRKGET